MDCLPYSGSSTWHLEIFGVRASGEPDTYLRGVGLGLMHAVDGMVGLMSYYLPSTCKVHESNTSAHQGLCHSRTMYEDEGS